AIHIVTDFCAGVGASILAYLVRFDSGAIPLDRIPPPFMRYAAFAFLVAGLLVAAFQIQGLYRLRRGRTRIDDFFGVLVGTLLASLLGVAGTLYVNTYHLSAELKAQGFLEISRW